MAVISVFDSIQKYPLLEKFGILNLDDKKYQDDIKDITRTFLDVVQNRINDYSNVYINWFGYPYDGIYKLIKFNNKCNINNVQLLIKHIPPGGNEINALLSNQAAVDNGYFNIENNKIDTCTILLIYNKQYIYSTNYKSIIEHELKHAFDILTEYKGVTELMNKDIITKETMFDAEIQKMIDTKQLSNNQYTISLTELKKINNNYVQKYSNDYKIMFPIMSDMLYYMNKSEVSARLVQLKVDNDIKNTTELYLEYYKLCDNIINYATNHVKSFINEIMEIAEYDKIYNIQFNKGPVSNVNKLFKFYKKRIKHFLKHCEQLLNESHDISYYFVNTGIPKWVRELTAPNIFCQ